MEWRQVEFGKICSIMESKESDFMNKLKQNNGIVLLKVMIFTICGISIINYFVTLPVMLHYILDCICYFGILALYLFKIRKIEYKIEYGIILFTVINIILKLVLILKL